MSHILLLLVWIPAGSRRKSRLLLTLKNYCFTGNCIRRMFHQFCHLLSLAKISFANFSPIMCGGCGDLCRIGGECGRAASKLTATSSCLFRIATGNGVGTVKIFSHSHFTFKTSPNGLCRFCSPHRPGTVESRVSTHGYPSILTTLVVYWALTTCQTMHHGCTIAIVQSFLASALLTQGGCSIEA